MMRKLYACLLLMHPPVFRRRFAVEMQCIFGEAASSTGAYPLIVDAVVSLSRQWIWRSGAWKVALAVVCACLQLTAGGLIWAALGHESRLHKSTSILNLVAMERLIRFILAWVGGIVLSVATASLWIRSFVGGRSRRLRPGR